MPGPVLPPTNATTTFPGLFPTVTDLLKRSLRIIGVLSGGSQGSELSADDFLDAMFSGNQLLDSWNTERLMVWGILRNVYTLQSGVQTYQLGPQQTGTAATTLDQNRYSKIERYSIISLTNAAQPLELPIESLTYIGWQAIPVKNIQSALSTKVYDDRAFPQRNLNFYPVPNTNIQAVVYPWTQVTQFTGLTQQLAFPPGYLRALAYNIAMELFPEWQGNPALLPVVQKIAVESKAAIKSLNVVSLEMACDSMVVGGVKGMIYNWLTDEPISKGYV
jgi:hypothetical protein